MIVTSVRATLRMSRQVDTRTWGTVELGAEATLGADEIWEDAQSTLYDDLKVQLSSLWKETHAGEPSTEEPTVQTPSQQAITPSTGEIQECPTHHKSAPSTHGGLYCPTELDAGSTTKWCTWNYGKPARRRRQNANR